MVDFTHVARCRHAAVTAAGARRPRRGRARAPVAQRRADPGLPARPPGRAGIPHRRVARTGHRCKRSRGGALRPPARVRELPRAARPRPRGTPRPARRGGIVGRGQPRLDAHAQGPARHREPGAAAAHARDAARHRRQGDRRRTHGLVRRQPGDVRCRRLRPALAAPHARWRAARQPIVHRRAPRDRPRGCAGRLHVPALCPPDARADGLCARRTREDRGPDRRARPRLPRCRRRRPRRPGREPDAAAELHPRGLRARGAGRPGRDARRRPHARHARRHRALRRRAAPAGRPRKAATNHPKEAAMSMPLERTRAALAAIDAWEPEVNAFTEVFGDEALARAAEAQAGGALAGVPVAVKDTIWMAGKHATRGSRAFREFVPDEHAVAVSRLLAAGAVVVGKTTNPELCFRGVTESALSGVTRNPFDRSRTTGGSSGVSAAAVSYSAVPVALGTDGGGSIRIPASFCGVVGHKPTFGLVPVTPGFRGWETLSVVGPLGRTVDDVRKALGVIAGHHPSDPSSLPDGAEVLHRPAPAPRTLRIAASVDLGHVPVEPDVRAAFAAALGTWRDAGWQIEYACPEPMLSAPLWA